MPNTKAAIRQLRRTTIRTQVNRVRKSKYRSAIKKMNSLILDKKKKEAVNFLPDFYSQLMKIAKTGVINKKSASRKISRVTKKIQQL